MTTTVADLACSMEVIAPLDLAASWDNVGLLVGDRAWAIERILLTIDLTPAVLQEAIDARASAVVAYHPPLFQPIRSLNADDPAQRLLLHAARAGIAIYSPHTALDAAEGGLNDWLAGIITGLPAPRSSAATPSEPAAGRADLAARRPRATTPQTGDVRALKSHERLPPSEETKIVTFCPADVVDRMRSALASIGAGRIGEYSQCSFELRGAGTFFGGEGANPTTGRRGALERVEEVRLEMVCPARSLALAVMTIRQFHPYEEPPIDIYPLRARPVRGAGEGRRILLDRPASLRAILDRIRKGLGRSRLQVAEAHDPPGRYGTIGLCAGAGGSLLPDALREGCTLYFTGEMRHHDILEAQARGCTIVLAGHTNTERGYLRILRTRLAEHLAQRQPGSRAGEGAEAVEIAISKRDADPLRAM